MVGNSRFLWDWKKSLSRCILKKWMSAIPIHVVTIWRLLSHTGGSVLPLRRKWVKERKSVWRRHIYRRYESWKWLQTQDKIYKQTEFYAGHVVLLANGFPRLNMCASTIFVVGTSGIPPKLNYSSVKSYNGTSNFIESTGVACSDSVGHNRVQVLSIPVLLLVCCSDWTRNH